MNKETAQLIMYGNLGEDSILKNLGNLYANDTMPKEQQIRGIYDEIYRLLDLATQY